MTSKSWISIVLLTVVTVIIIFGVIWNEAHKEIFYLCENFAPGVNKDSVIRQLDTGEYLRYESQMLPEGQRIFIDSAYNFGIYQCIVDLDATQIVIRREYHGFNAGVTL